MRTAFVLFVIAGLTDGIDGFLARTLQSTSRLGAYLDPIADKILLGATYIALGEMGWVPWYLVVIVFGRDILILLMVAYGFLFTTVREFPPSIWGKLSTVAQVLAVVLALTNFLHINYKFVWNVLAAITIWSGLHYAWRGVQILRKKPN